MINLSSFIRYHALREPARTALIYDGRTVSYAALMARIETTAGWLVARGVRPGDVVAVLMKNSSAFVEVSFAASHIGAVFLPINFRLSADEVAYICDNAGAKLLLVDDELTGGAAHVQNVVCVDRAAQADSTMLAKGAEPAPMVRCMPGDLFRLMYTSGTTDRPKGVMHTYENFYWKSSDHVIALQLTRATRLLVAGPLYHVGAYDLPGMAVLWAGGMISIERDFDPLRVLESIATYKLDSGWLAPVMAGGLLLEAERTSLDTSSFKWLIAGGERTPEPRIRKFGDCFPSARFIDAYGLTETCSGDTLMEPGREIEKIGSTGPAIAHVEISIRDDEGAVLASGEAGEICLRGPKVTKGYWKDPVKTAAAFVDGWFKTGDVGYLDKDGFLYLTDRKKDMILSGGENIASSEVERVLYEMPEIAEAAVIGVPDEKWGERPVAVVVLAKGASLDYAKLAGHCRSRLAGFKVPKELELRDALPRNPSGKVLKRVLRDDLLTRQKVS